MGDVRSARGVQSDCQYNDYMDGLYAASRIDPMTYGIGRSRIIGRSLFSYSRRPQWWQRLPRLESKAPIERSGMDDQKAELDSISKKLDSLTACMLQYLPGQPPSSVLENCTSDTKAQNACSPEGENLDMASRNRARIITGYTPDGNPTTKQINAKTEPALFDKGFETLLFSDRIDEFMPMIIARLTSMGMTIQDKDTSTKPEQKHRFEEYLKYWRKTYKQGGEVGTQYFLNAKGSILLDRFGDLFIEDIQPCDVQSFINDRAMKDGVCKKTIKGDWNMLKEVLDCAVADRIIDRNPAKDRRLTNNGKDGEGTKSLDPDEYYRIRQAIPSLTDEMERCYLALLAYTSFRPEEVNGLKWERFDWTEGHETIEVKEVVTYVSRKPVLKTTKTPKSNRRFPMCQELKAILYPCRKENGFVFAGDSSIGCMTSYAREKMWRHIQEQIPALEGVTPKNFRHTFTTVATIAGVDPTTTTGLTGHSNTDTPMNIYSHVVTSYLPQAIEKMNDFIVQFGN